MNVLEKDVPELSNLSTDHFYGKFHFQGKLNYKLLIVRAVLALLRYFWPK